MAGVRMFFCEAKRCLERDFSASLGQSLEVYYYQTYEQ